MENWIKAIFILIFIGVTIYSYFARKREESRRLPTSRSLPPDESDDRAPPKRRRSATEIDKFLEEVRRRREGGETRRPKPPPEPVRAPVAVPAPRRVESRPTPMPRRVLQTPPTRVPPPARAEPLRAELRPREELPARAEAVSLPEAVPVRAADSGRPVTTILGPVAKSKTMRQTLAMLKEPQSLVSAVLLQEILQRPVSQRKGFVPAYRK